MSHPYAKELCPSASCRYRYSICTLVTKWDEYCAMIDSFIGAGFAPEICEYLYVDNRTGNKADGYQGFNGFLSSAQGQYIILCHQDIALYDRIEQLDRCIRELDQADRTWALLGNAGSTESGTNVMRITDPSGSHSADKLPARVETLDENFILARRSANLCVSHDLTGFHFYGADLCQVARAVGCTAWVVNFSLYHGSSGSRDALFFQSRRQVLEKYRRTYRLGALQTPSAVLPVSSSTWVNQRAVFRALYDLRKRSRRQGTIGETEKRLMDAYALSASAYALHWVYYKLTNPFSNLSRSIAKRWKKRNN